MKAFKTKIAKLKWIKKILKNNFYNRYNLKNYLKMMIINKKITIIIFQIKVYRNHLQ
jgi:hypothetical protein